MGNKAADSTSHTCSMVQQTGPSLHSLPQRSTSSFRSSASGSVAAPLSTHGSSLPKKLCFPHWPLNAHLPGSCLGVYGSAATSWGASRDAAPSRAATRRRIPLRWAVSAASELARAFSTMRIPGSSEKRSRIQEATREGMVRQQGGRAVSCAGRRRNCWGDVGGFKLWRAHDGRSRQYVTRCDWGRTGPWPATEGPSACA